MDANENISAVPERVGRTGGCDPVAYALRDCDWHSHWIDQACYCLDAPGMMPSGGAVAGRTMGVCYREAAL